MNIAKLGITPGPWEIGNQDNSEMYSVYCDDETGQRVANCDGKYLFFSNDTKKANARLVAAAPEMLEALIDEYMFLEENCNELDEASIVMKNLIEKATNKSWSEIKAIL